MGLETALIIGGLALSAGGTAYQVKSGIDAKNTAQEQADKDAKAQQEAIDKQKLSDQQAENQKAQTMQANRVRQQASDTSQYTRGGTILTSPLGVPAYGAGGAQTANKTVLGS